WAYGVALQPDGKIVAAGVSLDWFALARYNPNGSPDPSFGTGGKVTTALAGPVDAFDNVGVALNPSGTIVVAGSFFHPTTSSSDIARVRYNRDGSRDTRDDDGDDLRAAASSAGGARSAGLSLEHVAPLLREALARWDAAGFDTTRLSSVAVQIADLPAS